MILATFCFSKDSLTLKLWHTLGMLYTPNKEKTEGEIFPGGDLGLIVDWNMDKTYKITTPPKNRCPTTALPNLLSQYGPALFRGKKLHFS